MSSMNSLIGAILILIGFIVLLTLIGIGAMLIGPLIFIVLGIVFLKKKRRLIGIILLALGIVAFFNTVFHINLGTVLVAILFLYFGYRMLKRRDESDGPAFQRDRRKRRGRDGGSDWIDAEIERIKKHIHPDPEPVTAGGPLFQRSFIGDLHLMHHRFVLEDMNIWHGIGDVKIDLSKAIIPEGETVLVINGWFGDVDIYIPYDLDVSVNATVTVGELDILDRRAAGVQRHLSVATKDYKLSTRRVKIIVSLFIGDINVRFL